MFFNRYADGIYSWLEQPWFTAKSNLKIEDFIGHAERQDRAYPLSSPIIRLSGATVGMVLRNYLCIYKPVFTPYYNGSTVSVLDSYGVSIPLSDTK